ncbi:hypothetical protein AAFC00_003608 [Neodothiora populina]|uniref:Uncharacterized protein n=1 Tax=Neodothiora populina TaxID=2781224 RepID=A0ABR3PFX9_9PEZI
MGGQAYLTKLALGRSAYEPIPAAPSDNEQQDMTADENEENFYSQRHDIKGNPINEDAKHRAEAQIAAKNEVLAAVGVCEKKNKEARGTSGTVSLSDEEWKVIRESENNLGETARIISECIRHASSFWLIALRRRIQAGVIDSRLPFSLLLRSEWRTFTSSGFRRACAYLMVGALPELGGQLLAIIFEYALEEAHMKLCELPFHLRFRRPGRQRMLRWIDRLNSGLLIAAQIFLSPLAVSAALQQLGFVSSTPLISLLPWSPTSALRWAWLERADPAPLGSRLLSVLLSPASLWACSNIFSQTISLGYGALPLCPDKLITGPGDQVRRPADFDEWPLKSPPSYLLPLTRLRDRVLYTVGWSSVKPKETNEEEEDDDNEDGHIFGPSFSSPSSRLSYPAPPLQNRNRILPTNDDNSNTPTRTHRTTSLATLPSHFLAFNLDSLLDQLLFLPLESLFLRALASSFAAAPGAVRSTLRGRLPSSSPPRFYSPGQGPFGRAARPLVSSGDGASGGAAGSVDWALTSGYVSKIGLCVGMQFTIDSVVWAGTYAWTRWTGTERFHWGQV